MLILSTLVFQLADAQVVYYSNTNLECEPRDFSVSVHMVLDSEENPNLTLEEIDNRLAEVSQYFEPLCWTFTACKVDSIRNYSYDTLNMQRYIKLQEHFNDDHMINLYFVGQSIIENFCHIANQDGMLEPDQASAVALRDCSAQDLVHKLCHLFGLHDTWNELETELVDGSNCTTTGDYLCSTPADPYLPGSLTEYVDNNCNFSVGIQDDNGDYFDPEVGNIMSAYHRCRNGLTLEQYETMRALYESLDYAPW